ncbi:MAG: Rrf2 family transcriptional regulator [Actinobacteria bacterium]|nr:Rrf2 family transcriptional regulator [Actinomycetota bacterium]MCL5882571.1 Rrf2 family transcriptional regulator [Actinomycetota bacterium]
MEISRQADYAIRAILDLSRFPAGELAQTRDIARRQGIPEKYLPTIVRTLARSGLLRTLRGSHGGITLARPPAQITLRDVVEAIDGPVLLNRCLLRPGECTVGASGYCSLHFFWERMVEEIEQKLEEINFGDLLDGKAVDFGLPDNG